MQKTNLINNICFFNSANDCINNYQKSPWIYRAISCIKSYGTLFLYALNRMYSSLFHRCNSQISRYTNIDVDGFSQSKLVVCVHGLNNHPKQFSSIIQEMEKHGLEGTDLYIPPVLKKGNAKLDKMVKPIFDVIEKWAATGGDKELVLIGISNGGRISRAIEAKLNEKRNQGLMTNISNFKFVSIVGACRGSRLAALAKKLHLSWVLSKNIAEEMPSNSARNQRLDRDWSLETTCMESLQREYFFMASPHDWQVNNYDSTLMEVKNHPAHYAIVKGHGHNSIVDKVSKTVAQIVVG